MWTKSTDEEDSLQHKNTTAFNPNFSFRLQLLSNSPKSTVNPDFSSLKWKSEANIKKPKKLQQQKVLQQEKLRFIWAEMQSELDNPASHLLH